MSADISHALDSAAVRAWRESERAECLIESDDQMQCALEAVRDWLGWIFEAGPHPVPVMRRLVACTANNAPWLVQGLPAAAVRALGVAAPIPTTLRTVLGVRAADVNTVLAQAYRREGRTWDPIAVPSSSEQMVAREEAIEPADSLIRARALGAWLRRVWDAGPCVREALKHLYVEARACAPELLLNMSGAEIAALFGQGRAAESARVKHRVNDFLARAGYRATHLRFQKSPTACATYALAQRGNKNRVKNARPKVAA